MKLILADKTSNHNLNLYFILNISQIKSSFKAIKN